jgi:resuscitation-promoting factor RpfA
VHEPDIAPLARRLAEENNVDWRRLSGTGEGGRVVERDVLGYLARVMAGDEAVDPTPEPVPEGMAAWPAEATVSGS